MPEISFADFEKVDIRVGKIVSVDDYPQARNPSFVLLIDFGPELGQKKSIAQLPANYSQDQLVGEHVACVVNFPPRQIGVKISEVLTLGFPDAEGQAVVVIPSKNVPLGGKLF